jgi:hypothetical protein
LLFSSVKIVLNLYALANATAVAAVLPASDKNAKVLAKADKPAIRP